MEATQETTPTELELIQKMRQNLSDLHVDKKHLTAKNLVRFLRARNHSLKNAETMFRKHIEWRKTYNMDNVQEWKLPAKYRGTYWPWYVAGFDRVGNPVVIHPFGIWDASKVGYVGHDNLVQYSNHCLETVWSEMQHRSLGQKVMKQVTIIFDGTGLSWRTVTTIDAMQGVLETLKCFEANFPETLHVAYVVNAPFAFDIFWRLVKPLLSEHTRKKMRFLPGSESSCWRDQLCEVISPENFWIKYGGDLPDYTEVPDIRVKTIGKR